MDEAWIVTEEGSCCGIKFIGVAANQESAKMLAEAHVREFNLDRAEEWREDLGGLVLVANHQYISVEKETVVK